MRRQVLLRSSVWWDMLTEYLGFLRFFSSPEWEYWESNSYLQILTLQVYCWVDGWFFKSTNFLAMIGISLFIASWYCYPYWARNSMSWFHRQVVSWHFTICYTKQFKLPIAAYFAFDTSRNSIKTKCLLCQFLGYTAIIWHWSLHSPSTWYCRYLHSSSDMWHFPSALFSTYLEIESISRHSFWRSNVSTQNRP